MQAHVYTPGHVALERVSTKRYMRIIAGFGVKYLEGPPANVWLIFFWPLKRGTLYGKGKPSTGQGAPRMEWLVPRCPYRTFVTQRKLLIKLAEVIGRARSYP